MSESEIVISSDALEDLQHGLKHFRAFLLDHLQEVKSQVHQLRKKLEEAYRDARNLVRSCQAAVDSADEEDDINSLYDELSEAEQHLHQLERIQRRIEELAQNYQREAIKMHQVADANLPRALAFVDQKQDAVRNLLGIQSEGSVFTGFVETGIRMIAELTETSINTGVDFMEGAISTVTGLLDFTSSPVPSGFQWMRLDSIELTEIWEEVKGPADFRPHTSYDTMIKGLETLRVKVLPAIASQGYTADSFFFAEMDRNADIDFENGTQRVYDAFFGQDAIALQFDPHTGKYNVINGRHRIKAAFDSGWLAVPVKALRKHTS